MDRRTFAFAAAAAFAWPVAMLAQAVDVPKIGFLYFASRDSAVSTGRVAAFLDGMQRLGYTPGKDFLLLERYADADLTLAAQHAGELVGLNVRVIVATGGQAVQAVRKASGEMPVIATVGSDPVGEALAKSLVKPGGSVTGLYVSTTELVGKQLELLIASVPRLSSVAVLINSSNPTHSARVHALEALARQRGLELVPERCGTPVDIDRAFGDMQRRRVGALVILGDSFFVQQSGQIADIAQRQRMPTIATTREFVEAGGLMSYGEDTVEHFRLAAGYVDKILKGARAGDLPFARTERIVLAINKRTARTLGVTVPSEVLLRADKIID